jgi:HPt (histidine-containing phosphotransfer) domain-containing protein
MPEIDSIIQIRTYLEEEFAMDKEEVDEMLEILLDNIQTQVSELEKAISSGDLSKVGEIGHAIKGAAGNIGATYISGLGKKLESPEIKSDSAQCSVMKEKLLEAISTLREQQT